MRLESTLPVTDNVWSVVVPTTTEVAVTSPWNVDTPVTKRFFVVVRPATDKLPSDLIKPVASIPIPVITPLAAIEILEPGVPCM